MEMSAKVNGIGSQLRKFDFLFGVMLGEKVLRFADNLSRTLQQKELSAAEGQLAAELTVDTLAMYRNVEEFSTFWASVMDKAAGVEVNEPILPWKHKVPITLEVGRSTGDTPKTPKDNYRRIYFEAFDLIMATIKDRFDQTGYRVYRNLEVLLLDSAAGKEINEDAFQTVTKLYATDFNSDLLRSQLSILGVQFAKSSLDATAISTKRKSITISAIKDFLVGLGGSCSLLSEVEKLLALVLVMPATNASSERSFSALRRIKTYLRSTTSQSRLNHLMILHVHKSLTDQLNLIDCANDFVSCNTHRLNLFGKFS